MRTKCIGYLIADNNFMQKVNKDIYKDIPGETKVMARLMIDAEGRKITRRYLEGIKRPEIRDDKHLNILKGRGFYGKPVHEAEYWEQELGVELGN